MSRHPKPKKQPLPPPDEAGGGSLSTGPFLVKFEARSPAQQLFLELYPKVDVLFGLGPAGTGKAQPLDSIVWTPTGPLSMGAVTPGQIVSTPDGYAASVLQVFPQGEKDIYRVTFHTGESVECCLDHLWRISRVHGAPCHRLMTTQDILRSGIRTPAGRRKFSIPVTAPVAFTSRPVLLDPYLLGALLGDGGISHSVYFTSVDDEIVDRVASVLPPGCYLKPIGWGVPEQYHYTPSFAIRRKASSGSNLVLDALRHYSLFGHKSATKFIPHDYLFNSLDVRRALLQGLMDTDGTVSSNGRQCNFTTVSPQLAKDVCTLVQSLGGVCRTRTKRPTYTHRGESRKGQLAYTITVVMPDPSSLFHLSRKRLRTLPREKYPPSRIIDSIEFVGHKPAQCLLLDSPEHLYLTDNFVVTHNTMAAVGAAMQDIQASRGRKSLLVLRPAVEAGRTLGYLPGDISEKIMPYMGSFTQALKKVAFNLPPGLVRFECLNFQRGMTYEDTIVCCDEAQNCTYAQLVMLLTRLGRNSKILVLGDPDQCDIRPSVAGYDVDLDAAVDALTGLARVGLVSYPASDSLRHPLVAKMLRRLNTQRG